MHRLLSALLVFLGVVALGAPAPAGVAERDAVPTLRCPPAPGGIPALDTWQEADPLPLPPALREPAKPRPPAALARELRLAPPARPVQDRARAARDDYRPPRKAAVGDGAPRAPPSA